MAVLLSGQITVTTAGTAVQGTDVEGYFYVKGLDGNTGLTYVGNVSGDVTASNGYELAAGGSGVYLEGNLNEYYFDAASNGDKVCWLKVAKP